MLWLESMAGEGSTMSHLVACGRSRTGTGRLLDDFENDADVRISIVYLRSANRAARTNRIWLYVYEWSKPFNSCYLSARWIWERLHVYSPLVIYPIDPTDESELAKRSGRWGRRDDRRNAARRARSEERRTRLHMLGMLV